MTERPPGRRDRPGAGRGARRRPEAPSEHLPVGDYLDAAEPHDLVAVHRRRCRRGGACRRAAAPAPRRSGWGNPTRDVDGWESPHTVVEIVTDDLPFIVDSVSTAIVRRGYDIHLLLHPLLAHESHLHLEIDRETDPAVLEQPARRADLGGRRRAGRGRRLGRRCAGVVALADALRRESPPAAADPADVAEAVTYLDWLADDHFTFVGAVRRRRPARPGLGLGVARRRPLFRPGADADPGSRTCSR